MVAILGILFALGAALSSGVEKILRRHVAIKVDILTYAFLFNLIAAMVMLPFYLRNFEIPSSTISWTLLIIPSILFAGTTFFMFQGAKRVEASVAAPISRVKLLIALAIAVIFLKETLNVTKVMGTLIVFFGLVFLSNKKAGKVIDFTNIGVYFILISVTITATAHIFEKAGLSYLNPEIYAFSVYFIPMLIFLPFFIAKKVSLKEIYNNRFWSLTLTAVLSASFHYLILNAFTFAEASVVIPIVELSNLVAVIGGITFLREREHIPKKLIVMVVILIGAILVGLS